MDNIPALMGTTALTANELLPDGVYIGLKETIYFKQKRIGSTDAKDLWKEPVNWWAKSEYNLNKKPRAWKYQNERDFGHGFHYLLLEGEDVYLEKCAFCPFDAMTTKDAKAWRDEAHLNEKVIISEDMDRHIRYMVALVANHPQLKDPMAAGLSEITVFWTDDDGHRFRARFDKLLPAYILDPKSFGAHNQGADDHERALRIVAKLSYDVQRYLYDIAREKMIEFLLDGKLYGGTEEERAWLQQFPEADEARMAERMEFYPNGHPDQQSAWSWSWLFMQKPSDSKGHGAVLLPVERPRFDTTWRSGKLKLERALQNYDHFKARFGLGEEPNEDGEIAVPWAAIHPLWRPGDDEFPPWMGNISSREHLGSASEEEGESE